MKPPASILVVVTRRIGDVLLTTPLIRSLKRAWPATAIDVLAFAGTAGVLDANPDVRRVLTIPQRPRWREHLALFATIARRYDVALSVVPSDRPTLYAWLAGRWRAGLVIDDVKHRWKKWLLQHWVAFDAAHTHTVLMHLALTRALDITPCYEVVASWGPADRAAAMRELPFKPDDAYAVLHAFPKFNYKMWRRDGWVEIMRWLQARGMRVVLSGGGEPAELQYVAAIAREVPGAIDLAGRLTLSQVACLIANARAYVGPDTAVTHLAAAVGVPVVALYGPTDPIKWGPWPAGYGRAVNPWRRLGTQRVNNVVLIQGNTACVPCFKEGCARSIDSFSDCLQHLPAVTVIGALAAVIDGAHPRTPMHG